jgi:hypothetical protein
VSVAVVLLLVFLAIWAKWTWREHVLNREAGRNVERWLREENARRAREGKPPLSH